jgi:hypothetical protein
MPATVRTAIAANDNEDPNQPDSFSAPEGQAKGVLNYPKDCPLRLSVAAKVAFPDGSMTDSGLRREAQRGRLVIERIAGKDYVTLDAINDMRGLCRAAVKGLASGYNQCVEERRAKFSNVPSGSSAKVRSSEALDAARAKLSKLRRG